MMSSEAGGARAKGVQINARRHVPTRSLVPPSSSKTSRNMSPIRRNQVPTSRNFDSSDDLLICMYYVNMSVSLAHEFVVQLLIT
jgi:hypothetical protein